MLLRTNIIQAGLPTQATTAPSVARIGVTSQLVSAQSEMFDAAAVGDTVTATASLVDGIASAAAGAVGTTQTATASLPISGAAIGNAVAAGGVLAIAGTLSVGSVSGNAAASGGLLTATATLSAGSAAILAPGDLITVTASLAGAFRPRASIAVEGIAAAGIGLDATANGDTVAAAATVIPGLAIGAADVLGQSLVATAAALAGTASGTATGAAAGATIAAHVSALAGAAAGGANKTGDTLIATASLAGAHRPRASIAVEGIATAAADVFAEGALLEATASLVPGVATGGEAVIVIIGGGAARMRFEPQDAAARGALIVCRARLIAGHASTLSLFPGMAHGDAEAANDNLPPVLVSLVAGEAQGQRSYSDSELLMIFAEAA